MAIKLTGHIEWPVNNSIRVMKCRRHKNILHSAHLLKLKSFDVNQRFKIVIG
jgi:hypothetical protein